MEATIPPTRLRVDLAGSGEAAFSELRRELAVSDGNLESHLKKLIAAGYVAVRKESGEGRPQSYYALTEVGLAALRTYVAALQRLLAFDTAESGSLPVGALRPNTAM